MELSCFSVICNETAKSAEGLKGFWTQKKNVFNRDFVNDPNAISPYNV